MPTRVIPVLFALALVAGCGGGGGGGGGGGSSSPSSNAALLTNLALSPAQNVLPISVRFGAYNLANQPIASVTVCAPGNASECQTIDGLLVDTGSTGLRIPAAALSQVSLPQQSDAGGNPIAECAQFAAGYIWGSVKIADVRIAGEQANSLPIQVIGDPALPRIPAGCASTGQAISSVLPFGANGILGIGAFRQDCGVACAQSSNYGIYYACPASGCQPAVRTLPEQITNPVSMFATDNNGVIVQLPAVPAAGAASVDGALIFGIGTQRNNALGKASVFTLDPLTGTFTTFYNGNVLDRSYIDTGSNALFFKDAGIPTCTSVVANLGLDCPVSTQSLSATIEGRNGTNASVTFSVGNADALLASGLAAFNNLAGTISSSVGLSSFDWGLPFFFGRNVYVAIERSNVPGAPSGPFVAF